MESTSEMNRGLKNVQTVSVIVVSANYRTWGMCRYYKIHPFVGGVRVPLLRNPMLLSHRELVSKVCSLDFRLNVALCIPEVLGTSHSSKRLLSTC